MDDAVSNWPQLQHGEIKLESSPELLWRQVNPQFVNNGQVTSQAFRPNSGDGNLISTCREEKQDARGAFEFYTTVLGRDSAGTWAVSVEQVVAVGARAFDDSESETAPQPCPPGHTSIDVRPFGPGRVKAISTVLSRHANVRGRQYPESS